MVIFNFQLLMLNFKIRVICGEKTTYTYEQHFWKKNDIYV